MIDTVKNMFCKIVEKKGDVQKNYDLVCHSGN